VGGLTGYAAWKITAMLTAGPSRITAVEEHGLDLPEMERSRIPISPDLSSAVVLSNEVRPAA